MYHVERVELEIVPLIEPRADKVVEPQAGASRWRARVDHELRDGPLVIGARLLVEEMDGAVSHLQVDVTGQCDIDFNRNAKPNLVRPRNTLR